METEEFIPVNDSDDLPQLLAVKGWTWWSLVALNIAFLLIGQAAAVTLGKLYYEKGGKSNWMAALVQTAGFPILLIPLVLFPSTKSLKTAITTYSSDPSVFAVVVMYIVLGILLAGDNMLYSLGLLYLPMSTYSLLTATQLVFSTTLSFFINAQKLTLLICNSVVLLTLSASLVVVQPVGSTDSKKYSKEKHVIGFICTVLASAAYALLLSLMQISFEKLIKRETFSVVLDMQIYTSLVASCVCVVGLFASGEAWGLKNEMEGFKEGKTVYVLGLVGSALAWQVSSVGVVGLIFLVSSLFSNVISMLTLPLAPVAGVLFYGESMTWEKIVAMFLAAMGCSSYIYQQYLDDMNSQAEESEELGSS
ncbi:hypothetical protein CDL15_Pgr002326 [Punica granatum]|nr:hypothetical protein CDL15_Pgr002326 [Punica granatum]